LQSPSHLHWLRAAAAANQPLLLTVAQLLRHVVVSFSLVITEERTTHSVDTGTTLADGARAMVSSVAS